MNGMLREHKLRGDLAVGEPSCYQGSHLPLTAGGGLVGPLWLVLGLGRASWGGGG